MPEQNVLLKQIYANNVIAIIDSQRSDKKGKFTFKEFTSEPGLYSLNFEGGRFILLSVANDEIKITGDWSSVENYSVTGSPASTSLKEFIKVTRQHLTDVNTLAVIMDTLKRKGNDSMLQMAKSDLKELNINYDQYVERYADTTRYEPNAIFAARLLNPAREAEFLTVFVSSLEKRFPNSRMTRDFMEYYHKIAELHKKPQPEAMHVDVGHPAPDIVSTTPEGNTLALSSLRGRYVLVDFWASWCQPCRKENPNVVKAFNQFKNKNFTVFSVSLDNRREDWVKAIKDDKLDWYNVSDLKGWNADAVMVYNVQAVPYNILVDTAGKVIARNLRGEALNNFLAQAIK